MGGYDNKRTDEIQREWKQIEDINETISSQRETTMKIKLNNIQSTLLMNLIVILLQERQYISLSTPKGITNNDEVIELSQLYDNPIEDDSIDSDIVYDHNFIVHRDNEWKVKYNHQKILSITEYQQCHTIIKTIENYVSTCIQQRVLARKQRRDEYYTKWINYEFEQVRVNYGPAKIFVDEAEYKLQEAMREHDQLRDHNHALRRRIDEIEFILQQGKQSSSTFGESVLTRPGCIIQYASSPYIDTINGKAIASYNTIEDDKDPFEICTLQPSEDENTYQARLARTIMDGIVHSRPIVFRQHMDRITIPTPYATEPVKDSDEVEDDESTEEREEERYDDWYPSDCYHEHSETESDSDDSNIAGSDYHDDFGSLDSKDHYDNNYAQNKRKKNPIKFFTNLKDFEKTYGHIKIPVSILTNDQESKPPFQSKMIKIRRFFQNCRRIDIKYSFTKQNYIQQLELDYLESK